MNYSEKEIHELHQQMFTFDIHTHPSLKTFLLNKKLYKRNCSSGAWNPFGMRVDFPKIKEGEMNGIFSAVYLPERELFLDCKPLCIAAWLLGGKFRRLMKNNSFELTVEMIKNFVNAVKKANAVGEIRAEIAYTFPDVERILQENKIVLLQTVEGAHSLNNELKNINVLFKMGICLLTLAHFYENKVAKTVGGIPKDKKYLGCFSKEGEQIGGLSEFGKNVVEEMLRIGMIVDLTHCTPQAREEVYQINNNRKPIVLSHVGVFEMNASAMNPTDVEIKKVADTGGIIGVICMNYWLYYQERKNGLDLIVRTIEHLRKVGGIDSIAIGSDFDGFTDPPDDIKDISKMPKLTNQLLKAGFSEEELEKIWHKNVLRVLETGWG
jgi:membrane dipeptidase